MRDRKQKLKPQILVWSLAFDQFSLGDPAGSMNAPDDTAQRFIKTHKPPHHDKVFEEVGGLHILHRFSTYWQEVHTFKSIRTMEGCTLNVLDIGEGATL